MARHFKQPAAPPPQRTAAQVLAALNEQFTADPELRIGLPTPVRLTVQEAAQDDSAPDPADEPEEDADIDDMPQQPIALPALDPDKPRPIDSAPLDGATVLLARNPDDGWVPAQYYRTRSMVPGKGWVLTPKWIHPLTRRPIIFIPLFWKPAPPDVVSA